MNSKLFTERGQALILIALAAVGIFGVVGLAIDGGAKFADQRAAQNAADTAALAAAYAKVDALLAGDTNSPPQCDSRNMGTASEVCLALVFAGLDRAASNGYSNPSSTVVIYSPPLTGPNAGNANFVQVIITSTVNTTFARVIGIQQTENTVLAEGFLRDGGYLAEGAMIISYDPDPTCSTSGTGGDSVSVSGDAEVTLTGGGLFLNSQNDCGFVIPSCADLIIDGGTINSAGADNVDLEGCTFDPPIDPNYNQDPVIIPDDVYWPDVPPECGQSPAKPTELGSITLPESPPLTVKEYLIYPGYYEVFPPKELVDVDLGKRSQVYLASGVYCIDPKGPGDKTDLSWSPISASLLNGSVDPAKNKYSVYNPDGVTLYVKAGGGFSINADSPTFLDASTSGDYQGYLLILEGTHTDITSCNITGGADIYINGMIFAPYCDITVNGQSGSTAEINAQLIGWDLKINGTQSINFNYDPSNLVEISSQVGLVR